MKRTKQSTCIRTLNRRAAVLLAVAGLAAWGLSADPPAESPVASKWWPSEWGAEDERGAANRLTPAKVLEGASFIKTGQVYQLGRIYEHGIPMPGNRHFSLTIPGLPTEQPRGTNAIVSNDEMFSGEIGQVGTQFDGLGHIGARVNGEDIFYNGFKLREFGTAYGLEKIGVEKVGVFFTRGVLIDVAGYKQVDRLQVGYVIRADELSGALEKQGVDIRPGDVVLIRTGHGKLWMKDNATYGEGEPGLGLESAKFLTDRKVVLIGADTWAIEAVPHEDTDLAYPVHQWDLMRNGVYHIENLDLEALAADKVYEFAFIFSPLRLKGATGSPGNPIAVR